MRSHRTEPARDPGLRDKLDSLVTALLEHETLDEEDVYAAAGVPRAAKPTADSYATAARSRT